MKKKKNLQILFFALLVIGFALTPFKETRPFGFLFLCVIQPIIALYYLALFKQTETDEKRDLILRYPLLISLQATFIVLIVKSLFRLMQWPFYGPVTMLLFAFVLVTVSLSIGFVVANRKIIQSIFVVELVMMTLPIILFLGTYASSEYSKAEYSEVLNKQYQDLNQIENVLYLSAKKDTLFDLTTVDFISQIKKGEAKINGDGSVIGSLEKISKIEIKFETKGGIAHSTIDSICKENVITKIEYLNALTKLQIDLLLKEKE
ncbi:MAG TPA: hypothetical protein VK796_13590 [Cytophaga sp.]|jgi:hypothetical protein|nr:hypothetical protein [Cytophaga sp.]